MTTTRRQLRRRITTAGLTANVAADLNLAVSTDGEPASSAQSTQITQHRGATRTRPAQTDDAPLEEER